MYEYGLIGNCQGSALVHRSGSIDWLCLPRPDSPPVFGALLDPEGGRFSVEGVGETRQTQRYLPNTNVLVTTVECPDGRFEITDFFPRYEQYGRIFRPNSLFRIIRPLEGAPRVKVTCAPVAGWDRKAVAPERGNSHLRYHIRGEVMRLLTNMSLTHLLEGNPVALTEPIYLALTWGSAIQEDLVRVTQDFLASTIRYWRIWVKHCSIPTEFQQETIRSALALKLHFYEDTGAILAALTTSLPEHAGGVRNWDYRLCWLRDSYFTLTAFHRLGHFEEMEGFLRFLLGLSRGEEPFAPVFRIDQTLPLPEEEHPAWRGYADSRPVRSGNAAATHVQNDVFGELLLAFAPIYFDERFNHLRTGEHDALMVDLAERCARSIAKPDAGLWELRDGWRERSFTNLMCWAGLDRFNDLRARGFFDGCRLDVAAELGKAEAAVRKGLVDGTLRNGPGDGTFDAALLQLATLRFPDRELIARTVDAIHGDLKLGSDKEALSYLFRYRRQDDFGVPGSAFVLCSFWWIQALARLGRIDEARVALRSVLASANHVGLFSEHFDPRARRQLGNFPQAYSHVGMILGAFAVSPSWEEIL